MSIKCKFYLLVALVVLVMLRRAGGRVGRSIEILALIVHHETHTNRTYFD